MTPNFIFLINRVNNHTKGGCMEVENVFESNTILFAHFRQWNYDMFETICCANDFQLDDFVNKLLIP